MVPAAPGMPPPEGRAERSTEARAERAARHSRTRCSYRCAVDAGASTWTRLAAARSSSSAANVSNCTLARQSMPLVMAGCNLKDASTWTLTEKGTTGELEIVHVLTEVDNAAACMAAETQLKAQAPNMTGLEGGVVTFRVGLTLQN